MDEEGKKLLAMRWELIPVIVFTKLHPELDPELIFEKIKNIKIVPQPKNAAYYSYEEIESFNYIGCYDPYFRKTHVIYPEHRIGDQWFGFSKDGTVMAIFG